MFVQARFRVASAHVFSSSQQRTQSCRERHTNKVRIHKLRTLWSHRSDEASVCAWHAAHDLCGAAASLRIKGAPHSVHPTLAHAMMRPCSEPSPALVCRAHLHAARQFCHAAAIAPCVRVDSPAHCIDRRALGLKHNRDTFHFRRTLQPDRFPLPRTRGRYGPRRWSAPQSSKHKPTSKTRRCHVLCMWTCRTASFGVRTRPSTELR